MDAATTTLALEGQGESITFVGAADPAVDRLEFEVELAPGAAGPAAHFHPKQSEHFEVVSGQLVAKVAGEEHRLGPGGAVIIRAGQVHSFANGSESEPVVFRCTAEPALHLQWFLTEMARSAIRSGGRWDRLSVKTAGAVPASVLRDPWSGYGVVAPDAEHVHLTQRLATGGERVER